MIQSTAAGGWARSIAYLVPIVLGLICIFFSFLPFGLIHSAIAVPAFLMTLVFYWALYEPESLPPYVVFLLGLVQDVVGGNPIGITSFVLVLLYGVVLSQRVLLLVRSRNVIWGVFFLSASLAAFVSWLIASIFYGIALNPLPLVSQTLTTVAVYPLLARLFSMVRRRTGTVR